MLPLQLPLLSPWLEAGLRHSRIISLLLHRLPAFSACSSYYLITLMPPFDLWIMLHVLRFAFDSRSELRS